MAGRKHTVSQWLVVLRDDQKVLFSSKRALKHVKEQLGPDLKSNSLTVTAGAFFVLCVVTLVLQT